MNMTEEKEDLVNHPSHYTSNESGIETIEITAPLRFAPGNATKYIARSNHKGNTEQDLSKARWYLQHILSNTDHHTGATRGLTQKEEDFIRGSGVSDNLKQAMREIFTGSVNGGAQSNYNSISKAIELIEKDLND